MSGKDWLRLEKIVMYCEQIEMAIERFGDVYDLFRQDCVYQNACSMCIMQIGEMANGLSDEALEALPQVPWRLIRGMRNVFAHNYGQIDLLVTWKTLHSDIADLKAAILQALAAK